MPNCTPTSAISTPFKSEPCTSMAVATSAEQHQREIVCGVEFQRDAGERRREGGDQQRADAAGDERSDRRDRQRGARPPLPRHLVAVDAGHHGGSLARQVGEDRGGRAAIARAVIDAGEHDERAIRRQPEGERQQHGNRHQRADAGDHADEGAERDAGEAVEEVPGGEGDAEAERQIVDQAHSAGRICRGIPRP